MWTYACFAWGRSGQVDFRSGTSTWDLVIFHISTLFRIPEWRSPSGRETFDPVLDGVPGNGGEGGVGEGVGGRVGTKGNRYEERMDLNLEPVPDYHDTDLQLSKYITKGNDSIVSEI